jgi:hypothetical protein
MWIQVGRFSFNTDNLTYIQVEMDDLEHAPKKVHLHFVNDRDNFALHQADAIHFLECLGTISCSDSGKIPLLERELVRNGLE